MNNLKELQQRIGYTFRNEKLLIQALTHSSYANEKRLGKHRDYERLEFLGDAVLEMVSSDCLFDTYKKAAEGELTSIRKELVCTNALSNKARAINLGKYIFLGRGEEQTGGRDRNALLEDVTEALIGAIYKDGGIAAAKHFIMSYVLNNVQQYQITDYKTEFQELLKDRCYDLEYKVTDTAGSDNNKTFYVTAFLSGTALGSGSGHTKKAAEQEAAKKSIEMIR